MKKFEVSIIIHGTTEVEIEAEDEEAVRNIVYDRNNKFLDTLDIYAGDVNLGISGIRRIKEIK